MSNLTSLPPLSLYIHLPWCVRKCPYCDFNSHEAHAEIPEEIYVDALIQDLKRDLHWVQDRPLISIFFGGGTPSLFSASAIAKLLAEVEACIPLCEPCEITLEANPGTVERERFKEFRSAGINRLSIGIQSFDDASLQALGRIHSGAEAQRAASCARAAGFNNFNLDLMYGLPGQSIAQARADIETALTLAPTHLSVYQLTLEPNTPFHARPPVLPDHETTAVMHEELRQRLAADSYGQYEVSAYAREEFQCRHNLNYWNFGDYLGIGAGAHAKITTPTGVTRLAKIKHPRQYMAAACAGTAIASNRRLDDADLVCEFMLNALRLTQGFPRDLFSARTGLPWSALEEPLQAAKKRGLITAAGGYIRPTDLGHRFLNDLVMYFLPSATPQSAY